MLLLIGLGAFVAILLLWTYKHRQGEGESNHKIDDVYASIKDVVFRRGDRRKNRKSGVPLTEDGDSQRSSTYVEGGKMVLPDGLNSEINQV